MTSADQVRRFYDKIWNVPDLAEIPALLHPDITFRGSLGSVAQGHSDFADYVRSVTTALSGYRCEIEQLVAEGDIVVEMFTATGTHTGTEIMGVAPSGRTVTLPGINIFRLRDGRIVERWGRLDDLGFLRQLGVSQHP